MTYSTGLLGDTPRIGPVPKPVAGLAADAGGEAAGLAATGGTGWPGGTGGTGGGATSGDGSGGTSTGKAATRITLKIRKRTGIVAGGWLFPAHAGKRVVVKLLKKVNGRFVLVAKHHPVLGRGMDLNGDGTRESKYRTSFKRPHTNRCRVVAKFLGDADHKASTARRTFSC